MSLDEVAFRLARLEEKDDLLALHHRSLRQLSFGFVNRRTIESFIQNSKTLDENLITDGTYYVAHFGTQIVACGGWSLRTPTYRTIATGLAGDESAGTPTVRAMFVDPAYSRRGIGRALLAYVEGKIALAGYRHGRLTATPMGLPLYKRCGWAAVNQCALTLPQGLSFPVYEMEKSCKEDERLHGQLRAA